MAQKMSGDTFIAEWSIMEAKELEYIYFKQLIIFIYVRN